MCVKYAVVFPATPHKRHVSDSFLRLPAHLRISFQDRLQLLNGEPITNRTVTITPSTHPHFNIPLAPKPQPVIGPAFTIPPDGFEFDTVQEAADYFSVSPHYIHGCLSAITQGHTIRRGILTGFSMNDLQVYEW